MEKLAARLLELQIFKLISARQKLLAYLYLSFLWHPIRARMKKDSLMRRYGRSRDVFSVVYDNRDDDSAIDFDATDVCLPRIPILGVIYYLISTATHIVIVLHSILLKSISVSKNQIADDFITCYMPRIHFHDILDQKYMIWFTLLYSSFHLILRSYVLIYARRFRLDAVTFILMRDSDHKQGWPPSLVQSETIGRLSESILFLRTHLARKRRMGLKLRPNRTPEARMELTKQIHLSFIITFFCLMTPVSIFGPIGLSQIFFKHESIFVDCKISYFDSIYWWRTVSSVSVCFVWYMDTYLIFTFPSALVSVLVVDLSQYWRAIEEKMLSHMNCARRSAQLRQIGMDEQESTFNGVGSANVVQDLSELRSLIGDFFRSLNRANGLVSLVLFTAFILWIVSNAGVTFLGLQVSGSSNIVVRLWQLIGFFIVLAISHLVLYVKRRTKPAYATLCSLMALDRSERKTEWIKILQHYTDRHSLYAFTLPWLGVFDELMFFKIVSYIASLIIFVERYQIHVAV